MSRSILTRTLKLTNALNNTHPRAASIASSIHRTAPPSSPAFHTTAIMSNNKNLDSQTISDITDKEKKLTGESRPVKGGPTAQAQKHAGETINPGAVSDITQGEKKVTGEGAPVPKGPAAMAQSLSTSDAPTGKLDSSTISEITSREAELTGNPNPAKGGPTAQAQKHVGESIGSENLHDITEGEKKVTGGERVKGGPTAAAQSELGKSRS